MVDLRDFDPFDSEIQRNPFPFYAEMVQRNPVFYVRELDSFVVTRYEDVKALSLRYDLLSSRGVVSGMFLDLNPVPEGRWLVALDSPQHARLRRVVSRGFSRSVADTLTPTINAIVDSLIAHSQLRPEFDFVADLSGTLPTLVIAQLLGVEDARCDDLKTWCDNMMEAATHPTDPEIRESIRWVMAQFRSYFLDQIEQRRTKPKDDLITEWVRTEEVNDELDTFDVLAMCALFAMAATRRQTSSSGAWQLRSLGIPINFSS